MCVCLSILSVVASRGFATTPNQINKKQVDAGEILDEALRSIEDLRSLILPLGFGEVDVRAFRSGAVSGGVTSPDASSPVVPGLGVDGGAPAGLADGVEVYRVQGGAAAATAGAPRPHE